MDKPEKPAHVDPYQTQAEDSAAEAPWPALVPQRIGRYRVERVLGEGSFGVVYLAHDDTLDRPVAIKVPRPTSSPDRQRSRAS